jgi:radical SAM protein (TIGR01212 family)
MASSVSTSPAFDWRAAGLHYFSYGFYLRQKFGFRVQRVSVDAGLTCPNVDGTVASGGCVYCDNRSFSPSRRLVRQGIRGQIDEGIRRIKQRYACNHFMAYFQPATNTFAPEHQLRPLYREALSHPDVVALAIGTRPDCVADEILELLTEVAETTHLSVEYGMQTMHDRSLDWMNRGHHHDAFVDAMQRSRGRGFEIGAHVILGLPGESHQDMMATAREVARLGVNAVKIHNLYAVKNTVLADQVQRGEVTLMDQTAYVRAVVDFLELLPPTTVVERISGEAPPGFLVAPSWCADKPSVRAAVDDLFRRRGSWQGRRWGENEGVEYCSGPPGRQ